jgi:formylglycine-generating enzyme required for sulfatase activity
MVTARRTKGGDRSKQPVINVHWNDAQAYLKWLSNKTGQKYRLLTEAEREYATRAGTFTPFWWGPKITPEQANFDGAREYRGGGTKGSFRQRTVPVDSFKPNSWGLYNVHGNVWEWTQDCWNSSNDGNTGDGNARITGDCFRRVVRGGSWGDNPGYMRAAVRTSLRTDYRNNNVGFRVARTL